MRRLAPLILVGLVAFGAGAAGASGTLARLWNDGRVGQSAAPTTATAPVPTAAGTRAPGVATPRDTATSSPVNPTSTTTITGTATPRASVTAAAIPAPVSMAQAVDGGGVLPAGGWTNASRLLLQVMAPADRSDLQAEIELRRQGVPFAGTATASSAVSGGVASLVEGGLAPGRYHWQARLVSGVNRGPWQAFARDVVAFGVQRTAPGAPVITSPTDPVAGRSYATSSVSFTWSQPADPSGIAGYSFRLDQNAQGGARRVVRTQENRVDLGGLGSGSYYFHVRALDHAGNWGAVATYPLRVDVTAPQVTRAIFSQYYFDPSLEALHVSYSFDKVAHVTAGVYDASGRRVRHIVLNGLKPANVPLDFAWDGRDDRGQTVPAGAYNVYLRATDRLGNSNAAGWAGFTVTYKRVVVSLSQQKLIAYEGNRVVLTTLVTTGNQKLPTPTGLFHIVFARHPFTFHSPWPKGSPYYYDPSPVSYALYFHDPGYFIHDAPWRSQFGPGSNALAGKPGQNGTGTHGCVNVPANVMGALYSWATPGTPVEIKP